VTAAAPASGNGGAGGTSASVARLAYVLVAVAVAFGLFLHAWPLQDPDEGRYTDIAHAMARGGDWFCARLNGLRYQEKPPFFFWLVAASLRIFGDNEVAARLPSTLASFATVALIGWFARRRLGERAGGLAALLLAATPLFALLARFVLVDLTLTLFVTATTICAHEAMGLGAPPRDEGAKLCRSWANAAWLCAGFACLIKGPIGLALPIAGLALFLVAERRFRLLLQWLRPDGLALFAAVVVPAYWLAERASPGFLRAFIVEQNFGRLTSGESFGRDHPFWYYVPIFAAGFLPGSLRLPAIARGVFGADDGKRATRRFFACAVAGPFALLSAAHSMLAYYLLPLAPPFALLTADALLRKDDAAAATNAAAPGSRGGSRLGAFGYGLFAALFTLIVVVAVAANFTTPARLLELLPAVVTRRQEGPELGVRVATVHAALPWFAATLAPLALALVVATRFSARRQSLRAAVAAAGGMVALALVVPLALGAGARLFTSKPVADRIRQVQRPGETVFLYDLHLRGLAFYLGRDVVLWSASFAEFGHDISMEEARGDPQHERGRALQKDPGELAKLFAEAPSLLVLLRGDDHLPDLARAKGMRFEELWRDGDFILLRGVRL
jgi:4-amino-4-deoxy-L-arabinose transferase-like glycosyltransferase